MTRPSGTSDLETRLTAALADTARRNLSEATPVPALRPDRAPSRIRSWALPVLAATVVAAVTIAALVLAHHDRDSSAPPAGKTPGSLVTLRARTTGLSATELDTARRIISARAMALGTTNPEVRISGPDEITAFLPGVATADAGQLGTADLLRFRPLIVEPVVVASEPPASSPSPSAPQAIDQWKTLGFPPPSDVTAYRALSPAQQHAVQTVLNDWDCRDLSLDRANAPIVACDPNGDNKYLLGTGIISGSDIQSADVVPGLGQESWQVIVGLSTAGQQRWTGYTAQHNESNQQGAIANQVATVVDGSVIVASTIQSTITGDTLIASGFDQRRATALAADLTGGSLPVPFDVVSIQGR